MLPNSSTATLRRKAMPFSRSPIRSPVFAFPPPPLAALRDDSPLPQLIFLNLQRPLQHLLRLRSPDRHMTSDLLVPPYREGSDGIASFGRDGGLPGELFEHFGGSGQAIAGFADGDVFASERSERFGEQRDGEGVEGKPNACQDMTRQSEEGFRRMVDVIGQEEVRSVR